MVPVGDGLTRKKRNWHLCLRILVKCYESVAETSRRHELRPARNMVC
jgi:hypothetical protein